MTRQCRELTGLTQPEINASRDSNEVFAEVAELLKKYSVSSLYVWGNFDRPGLAGDMNQHRRTGKDFSSIKKIYNCIADIQDATIKQMGLPQAVSISELSAVFGYEPQSGSFHNALSDGRPAPDGGQQQPRQAEDERDAHHGHRSALGLATKPAVEAVLPETDPSAEAYHGVRQPGGIAQQLVEQPCQGHGQT